MHYGLEKKKVEAIELIIGKFPKKIYKSCNMHYNINLPNIKPKWNAAVYPIIFYENLNMYINNIDNMPIYKINVLLGIMKMILSIYISRDQSQGCYTFLRKKVFSESFS